MILKILQILSLLCVSGLCGFGQDTSTDAIEQTVEQKAHERVKWLLDWVRYAHPYLHDPWSCNSNLQWAREVNKRFGKRSYNYNCSHLTYLLKKALHSGIRHAMHQLFMSVGSFFKILN